MLRKTLLASKKAFSRKQFIKDFILFSFVIVLLCMAFFLVWVATLDLPDLKNFESRQVANSTKIYDKTGKVLLYNIHADIKRTEVPLSEMSIYVQQAHIAIEDAEFYSHIGIRPTSIIRAVLENILPGGGSSGGSTITQQVIKNALLTREKTVTRKVKEWILAVKLERQLTKDQILAIYLNESPYGGTMYGVEEAARAYFRKSAKDLTLTESAYLAAMTQRPSFYSPYRENRDKLELRKNFVLQRMVDAGFITEEQKIAGWNENITFQPITESSGKALHFVFYIRDYLENKYSEETLEKDGLQVITTLDWALQEQLEKQLKEYVLKNEATTQMSNASLVAIDPKTGQILSMIGSRDFFDEKIDGKVNVALRGRQPGSSIKPLVYASAFQEGYTPETIVFDVPTEFNVSCPPSATSAESRCYSPDNFGGTFSGPVTLRNALAQSLNVPAVKTLYLTGLDDAILLARQMGVRGLEDKNRIGLTLVLGGGEVSLLDLTNAYGTFANNGVSHSPTGILKVVDKFGNTLEEYKDRGQEVISPETAAAISSILSDNDARAPVFGAQSQLYFPDRPVAAKTGTTQNARDTWIIGYTPSLVIGMWGGNNNNTPMNARSASVVLGPIWNQSMRTALASSTVIESFPEYTSSATSSDIKPVLRGIWCITDENENPIVHDILHWVDKNDPRNPFGNSTNDPQYNHWEYGTRNWFASNPASCGNIFRPEAGLFDENGNAISD